MQPKIVLVGLSVLMLGLNLPEAVRPVLWLDASSGWGLTQESWRLVSAHLVHLNLYHALLNIAGLWLCYVLTPELFNRALTLKMLYLAVGISICLWFFSPNLLPYAGFSGVLYGMFVLGLIPRVWHKDWRTAAILIILSFWMLLPFMFGNIEAEEKLIGGRIATMAHVYGYGLAIVLLALNWTLSRQKCSISHQP